MSSSSAPSSPIIDLIPAEGAPIVLPRGVKRGDVIRVEATRFDDRGHGRTEIEVLLGPQQAPRMYTITTPHLLPGEVATVEVTLSKKGQLATELIARERVSAQRVDAPCPHFGPRNLHQETGCGGCTLQSLAYADQLQYKQDTVHDALSSVPLAADCVRPILGCEQPFFYRNKMEFSFGDHRQTSFAVGLHPAGRRYDVLALQSCHLLSPWVEALLPELAAWCEERGLEPYRHSRHQGFLRQLMLREGKHTGERLVELMTSSFDEAMWRGELRPARQVAHEVCEAILEISRRKGFEITTIYWTQHHIKKGERSRQIEEIVHGEGVYHERLEPGEGHEALEFAIHPRAFFQPNTKQAERLYRQVLEAACVQGDGVDLALDLYCGTGTIALCLGQAVGQVLGIELNAQAVENARANAHHNAMKNAEFFAGDVAQVLEREDFLEVLAGRRIDLVVVDPPRAGLMPQALEHLQKIGAPRLVYVSCNPRSLARDLGRLLEETDYELQYVQPVDMFPQTLHVENVALLVRRHPA